MQGSQDGWIEMKPCEYNGVTCWETNVVPDYTITKLMANGTEERTLSSGITPVAGKFYNITLNKDKGYTDDGQGNYTVTSAEGLKNLAELMNGGATDIDITLDTDLDLTNMEWTPIGTDNSNKYTGTFDGGNYTITGLTVTGSDQYAGLFGCIGSGGAMKNVTLKDVEIESNHGLGNVGGVAGWSYGNIENCSVAGSVSGSGKNISAGGVVDYQLGGSITECSSSATVNAGNTAGGMADGTYSATLTGCYATGDMTLKSNNSGGNFTGGVVGSNNSSTLIACYATGSVSGFGSGTIYVGGVTGQNNKAFNDPVITACYWGSNPDTGIGDNQAGTDVETTKVADGNWTAVTQMNAALNESSWQYELTGALPTLKKQ